MQPSRCGCVERAVDAEACAAARETTVTKEQSMNSRVGLAVVAGMLTLGLAACGGDKKETSGSATQGAPAAAAPAKAVSTGATEFGVPECDEYLTKYLGCVESKVPEAARGMVRQQLDATKASWKQAAATPEGRAGLATACKQALEATKQAMAAYGCTW